MKPVDQYCAITQELSECSTKQLGRITMRSILFQNSSPIFFLWTSTIHQKPFTLCSESENLRLFLTITGDIKRTEAAIVRNYACMQSLIVE